MLLRGLVMVVMALSSLAAATLPDGFSEVQVAGGLDPTGMVFAPDGRLFIAEKPGRVRVVDRGALVAQPFLDIAAQVDNYNERGLVGIALHPQFSTNGWVYVYYTARSSAHNRVSRFTASGNVAVAGSERIVLDLETLGAGNHNGGGLGFGPDGRLYIAQGENTVATNAQQLDTRLGKVLRLEDDGRIPTDNPWYTPGDPVRSSLFAIGLRNPFAMSVHPTTGQIFVNDVGAGFREEVNRLVAGANYGWPVHEGQVASSSLAGYRNPEHAYDHGVGFCITGGAFYHPAVPGTDAFPAAYTDTYFLCDYLGWIRRIDPSNPATRIDFATGIDRALDVEAAPDGSLWYLARGGQGGGSEADNTASSNGTLWRIRYTGNVPTATHLGILQQPTSVAGGAVITPPIQVAVQDEAGATVVTSTATVTLAFAENPGGGGLTGQVSRPAIRGVATFDDVRIATPASGYRIRASAAGLTSATSAAFTVLSQVPAPSIRPGTGVFSGPVVVQLTCGTAGATMRYTLDGTAPTATSPVYTGPFTRSSTTTVRALAERSGMTPSAASEATMTIQGSTPYGLPGREEVTGLAIPAADALQGSLSTTGLFSDLGTLTARPGIVPFTVNSPLWSDQAAKRRWMALPGAMTIGFAPSGAYTWPAGTVMVKHFELDVDDGPAAQMRRLETRVLVVDGDRSYGLTYRWRSDGREADLVPDAGADEVIPIAVPGGGVRQQAWRYPSRSECLQCHTALSGRVLGPKTGQLNGYFTYPNGVADHQLRAWNAIRLFGSDIGEAGMATRERLVAVDDPTAPLEMRVRSYLDANCAGCHRPGGTPTAWDARFETPLASTGIVLGAVRDGLGIPGARVVVPQQTASSVLYARLVATQSTVQMPPIGRRLVHGPGVAAVQQWIESMPSTLPTPWITADVGAPALAGAASFVDGIMTVTGSGADIWGASDQFRWVYQDLEGDGSMTARIDGMQSTDPSAKAGVMIRASAAADAPMVMSLVTSGSGAAMQWRAVAGGGMSHVAQVGAVPAWVRLVRGGGQVQAFIADDAAGAPGTWTPIGAPVEFSTGRVLIGLAVTSHQPALRNRAEFSHVQVQRFVGGLRGEYWRGQDRTFNGAPTLVRTDATVDFGWGAGTPDAAVGVDRFTVRWSGTVLPPASGDWTFITRSDDGVRLWVDNRLVVDRWIDQAATDSAGQITLTGGRPVALRLEYYENGGDAECRLQWQGPGTARQTISSDALRPPAATLAVNINFQPATSPGVPGYVIDAGEVYGPRQGQTYGWWASVADTARDRGVEADQVRDTLVHMQKAAVPDAVWEMEVPRGVYQVTAVCGDPAYYDSVMHLQIEGVTVVQGTPTSSRRFCEGTATVTVTDGRLTMRCGPGATNTKICFLEIQSLPTATQ